MDIKYLKINIFAGRFIERTLSMFDETASKSLHKKEANDQGRKKKQGNAQSNARLQD